MAEKSGISWTDSTWNPVTGCTKISEGCRNCYAEKMSQRLQAMQPKGRYYNGFNLTTHESVLNEPLKWKKPNKVFVNSMSDLFHNDVPSEFLTKVFLIMKQCPQHTFQILTKRPNLMKKYILNYGWKLQNVWLGVSVENKYNTDRIDILKTIPAGKKFISFEPLIGDVGNINLEGIDWAIVGGESGPGHRQIKEEWILNIQEQCKKYNTAFYFKQWGGQTSNSKGRLLKGKEYLEYPK